MNKTNLEMCQDLYPKGTIFKCLFDGNVYESTGEFEEGPLGICSEAGMIYKTKDDTWAEITLKKAIIPQVGKVCIFSDSPILDPRHADFENDFHRNYVIRTLVAFRPNDLFQDDEDVDWEYCIEIDLTSLRFI